MSIYDSLRETLSRQSIYTWNMIKSSGGNGSAIREDGLSSVNLVYIARAVSESLPLPGDPRFFLTAFTADTESSTGADWCWGVLHGEEDMNWGPDQSPGFSTHASAVSDQPMARGPSKVYLVQAKRIDVGSYSYPIDLEQANQLIKTAEEKSSPTLPVFPTYVLYTCASEPFLYELIDRLEATGVIGRQVDYATYKNNIEILKSRLGCVFLDARAIVGYFGQLQKAKEKPQDAYLFIDGIRKKDKQPKLMTLSVDDALFKLNARPWYDMFIPPSWNTGP